MPQHGVLDDEFSATSNRVDRSVRDARSGVRGDHRLPGRARSSHPPAPQKQRSVQAVQRGPNHLLL